MKIIVAGAGHGGIVAASKLAKNGFDVTVYEKGTKESLGHDWEDRFTFKYLLDAIEEEELQPEDFRYRGDCAFISPSYRTSVVINYNDETRQKIMWRKTLIGKLLSYAEKCGVKFVYETKVNGAILDGRRVVGISTDKGDEFADMIIDACGCFSPVRESLPEDIGIEKDPQRGDLFYANRAYFNKESDVNPDVPFEIYLYHEGEQGLSWFCTNKDSVDVLVGRIDPIDDDKMIEQMRIFKERHPWLGTEVLHGGNYAVIPVRRPLGLMVCDGYAAVGDSAFMTTPMNGMGIDLSILAGQLLADNIIKYKTSDKEKLWEYNRDFHVLYGGDTAKNEGLKNSLLQLPYEGVDFLFDNAVIQSSDLSGAGRNTNIGALLGKFVRGMKKPKYFFAIIKGLIKGGKVCKIYKKAPQKYDRQAIDKWQKDIENNVLRVTRRG